MSIQSKPKTAKRAKADAFIAGAPDSGRPEPGGAGPGVVKGKKVQITVTFPPDLLRAVDKLADRSGLSRAALINLGAKHIVNNGLSLDAVQNDD